MSAGRVVGGIIALVAGIFVLIPAILLYTGGQIDSYIAMEYWDFVINWILYLVVAVIAIIGGILGLASKGGGAPALIAGLIALIMGLLWILNVLPLYVPISLFQSIIIPGIIFTLFGISIEAIMMILGGVIMLASRGD